MDQQLSQETPIKDYTAISDFINSGNTYQEAEEKYGVHHQTIRINFKKLKIKPDPWKNRTKLTDKEINLAFQMYKDGCTQQEILKNLGANHKTLNRALKMKNLKVESKWRILTDTQVKKVKTLRANGVSLQDIAELLGIERNKINNYFSNYDDKLPPINFKPTRKEYENLIYFLNSGMKKKDIAFELNTSRQFVRLMMCKLGATLYFEAFKYKKHPHVLKIADLFRYIDYRFKGTTNLELSKRMGVSRVTINHYIAQCERMFKILLKSQKPKNRRVK